jgi:hypothetical protein
MIKYGILAAMIAVSTTAAADPWESTQVVEDRDGKATALLLPSGTTTIVITMEGKSIHPSNTCLAINIASRFVGGEVAQKGNVCTIHLELPCEQVIVFGIRNDDFVKHSYNFLVSHQP